MKHLVWLKDDLRLHDSQAVLAAARAVGAENLVFIRSDEREFTHVPPTPRRIEREVDAIAEVRAVLERSGTTLHLTRGQAEDIVRTCRDHGATTVHANMQIGDELGYHRDRQAGALMREAGIAYVEYAVDGLVRGSGQRADPLVTGARDVPGLRFTSVPQAMQRLRDYLERLPRAGYRRDMWIPGPDATASSRLSVDLACGTITGDRVLHEIERAADADDPRNHHAYRQFANRIHWRRGFLQTLERNVDAFPWGPVRQERPEDAERMRRWRHGETGYPLVDAAMRQLAAEGWINFRLRQVVCSFAIDLLDLDLHRVGVELGRMFDDYSPGIHWSQIAMQSGMVPGQGPRVVNPVKQARDLDPKGAYVIRMLPHMSGISADDLFMPWQNASYAGPPPMIEHMEAGRAARARHPSVRKD